MKIHPRFWRDGDLDWDVIKEKNECNQVLVKLTLCIWYVFELLKNLFWNLNDLNVLNGNNWILF